MSAEELHTELPINRRTQAMFKSVLQILDSSCIEVNSPSLQFCSYIFQSCHN